MEKVRKYLTASVAVAILAVGTTASRPGGAQDVLSLLLAPIFGVGTGMTLSRVVDSFEDAAARTIARGESTGNRLIGNLGNQLQVQIANARTAIREANIDLSMTLSTAEAQAVRDAGTVLRERLAEAQQGLEQSSEIAKLDMLFVLRSLPFVDVPDFHVSRMEGLIAVPDDQPHDITFYGLGFDVSGAPGGYSLTIEGVTVPQDKTFSPQPVQDEQRLTVRIPRSTLKPHQKDDDWVFLSGELKVTVNGVAHTQLFPLTLLPRIAGRYRLSETIVNFDYIGLEWRDFSRTVHNCSTDGPCWVEVPAAFGRHVVVADPKEEYCRFDCIPSDGNTCEFCYNVHDDVPRYQQTYSDVPRFRCDIKKTGDNQWTLYQKCDGDEGSAELIWKVGVKQKGEKSHDLSYEDSFPFFWNESFTLNLHQHNKYKRFRLRIEMTSGIKWTVDQNTLDALPMDQPLRFVRFSDPIPTTEHRDGWPTHRYDAVFMAKYPW